MVQARLQEDIKPRLYQEHIFASSLNKNTLVILPTGLGKTLVSLMLAVYYKNNNKKKILFLAPTKPLVEQQKKAFEKSIVNANEFKFLTLTGEVGPQKRKQLYDADFIFSTPQLIENDIINSIINPNEFSLVIFDECHRAQGNYAYTFIAQEFNKAYANILALSASPGSSKEEIKTLISNLFIEHIELRTYEDEDVQEYVKGTDIEYIKVKLTDEIDSIRKKLYLTYQKKLSYLKEEGFFKGKQTNYITKKDLLDLQIILRRDIGNKESKSETFWKAISISAGLMKLSYGIELLETQDISVAYEYFYNFFREGGDSTKAAKELMLDVDFVEAFEDIRDLHKKGVKHPKLLKLKELVIKELKDRKDLRIIIFNQYRDTTQNIVKELSTIKEIRPSVFVGQARKGDTKLSQKDQKRIIEEFREGKFNVLVSTSVGEEGLDIPKVDLVIFYEPVASAIRTIQRVGRTGRFDRGKAYVLQSEGTRDIVTKHIASAKEKKMYKVLDELKEEMGTPRSLGLNNFIKHQEEEKIIVDSRFDDRVKIIIDSRENTSLIKVLYKFPDIQIETKVLEVGDIVISEHIAIERKSKADFISSLLDKRLFPQLMDLARNYRRPVLILEGEENIFTLRNLNPNAIRSSLSAIAVDLRIPIIFTDSVEETANMISTIAKRTIRPEKDISLSADKRALSLDQELERFISTIPKINVVTAKSLLKHFKSIKNLANATEKELQECEGLGKVRAKSLKEFFEREYKGL